MCIAARLPRPFGATSRSTYAGRRAGVCGQRVRGTRHGTCCARSAEACGPSLIDVHADPDHHRSVFTLAGPGPRDARRRRARRSRPRSPITCSIVGHDGEHPRFGALDVVPFVALGGTKAERGAGRRAKRARSASGGPIEFDVPVFLYDEADPDGHDLPHARSHGFRSHAHPTSAPACRIPRSARPPSVRVGPLVAVQLRARELATSRSPAGSPASMRERDGGLRGVRALGFFLHRCRTGRRCR